MEDTHKKLLDQYPFISFITYGGNDYIGIIQNFDEVITTIYDFAALRTLEQKTRFLELADQWWWESNRMIPIGIFLRKELMKFKEVLMMMNTKDVSVKIGPVTSLNNLAMKRSKRKSVQLVRKPK